jgi:hypothetical protein
MIITYKRRVYSPLKKGFSKLKKEDLDYRKALKRIY